MNDERDVSPSPSRQISRLSNTSTKYFDYYDTHHSVFSRNSYYHDMHDVHPWSRRPCSRHSGIPFATLRATSCSPRLDELARPKIKRERLIRQAFFDNFHNYAYSGVSDSAMKAECSARVQKLSQPKPTPHGYVEAYTLPRTVSEQALHATTTGRLEELAKPRRNAIHANAAWKKSRNKSKK